MIRRLRLPLLCLALLAMMTALQAQPEFPELTGRVVDRADILDSDEEARLSAMLEAHEQETTEQVVVVTVPDLQGSAIEEYGYQLGRQWGIGQAEEDNGALLLVAMEEREVRIEVGYGLEGRLTDAQASVIIHQIITPEFRQGNFSRGIMEGAEAMIDVLGGNPVETQGGTNADAAERREGPMSLLFFVMFIIVMTIVRSGGGRGGRGRRGGRSGLLAGALLGAGAGRGGGGGFGGGGFGGGGGGFGGGGASGGW